MIYSAFLFDTHSKNNGLFKIKYSQFGYKWSDAGLFYPKMLMDVTTIHQMVIYNQIIAFVHILPNWVKKEPSIRVFKWIFKDNWNIYFINT